MNIGLPTSLEEQTIDQPFCGGVYVLCRSRLVFTIAKPRRWREENGQQVIPVAWIGGGQESGENVRECALREAIEELGCPVSLVSAPDTFWFESGRPRAPIPLTDATRPFMVEMRPGLKTPYKTGLPVGPIVYVAVYQARVLGRMTPGDVPGLIEVPVQFCHSVWDGITVREAKELGIPIYERISLPDDGVLRFVRGGPEELLLRLWLQGLLPVS